MRKGFTTGSAAAAAAKAAAFMLFSGVIKEHISIITPASIEYRPDIIDARIGDGFATASVLKDSGDDPDVTNGAKIRATVIMISSDLCDEKIVIKGGEGVGIVTKPGLDQKVGEYAINSVPREMIKSEIMSVCELFDYKDSIEVVISVENGEEIAKSTFNGRLGIEGGISIIGTSGIVEPMSTKALLDTIYVELKQRKELGYETALITPGNYGREFLLRTYDFDIEKCVKCSNFIGETIDMAIDLGFNRLFLAGHIGKLVKVSGGIMDTHSKVADCRMELIVSAMLRAGIEDIELVKHILNCVTTDEALMLLDEKNHLGSTMKKIMEKVMFYLDKRADAKIIIDCLIYSNEFGVLGKSSGVDKIICDYR